MKDEHQVDKSDIPKLITKPIHTHLGYWEPKSNSIPYIFPLERKTEGQRQRYNSSQIDQIRGHFPHKAQEGALSKIWPPREKSPQQIHALAPLWHLSHLYEVMVNVALQEPAHNL